MGASCLLPTHSSHTPPTPDPTAATKPLIVVGNLPIGMTWSHEHGRMLGTPTRPCFTEEGAADLKGGLLRSISALPAGAHVRPRGEHSQGP